MSVEEFDVAVVGGGLHGLSAALHLARAGRRVAVIERRWTGRHASGATAAGVRTLNRDIAEVPISLEAMAMWHRIASIVGDDCGFHAHGQMRIAERDEHMPALMQREAKMRSLGYEHEEMIDAADLRRLVPALSPHCIGALIARNDGAADPHRTILAFRRACEAEGVVIAEGCGVEAVERQGEGWLLACGARRFRAPVVVNAAGAWAGRLAALFGDEIALGVRASMMMVTERLAPLLAPVVSVVGRALSFKQSDQGTLVIGGGLQGAADVEGESSTVNFTELAKGARAASDLFPIVRGVRVARCWTGIEAQTSDHLPVIGASPNASGLFHAFGFSGHGFQLVPVVGAILTDLVTAGTTRREIAAFAPGRLMQERVAA
ncbi:MAG TPA: FAD-dependent oxidoreductase [Bosea sp. (in: a-proteobacteria)]|jgi:sarcosine oxidase subunit beta|uniref:NAD(P)/FAD-dependent oxidoreductase n=1 Tax=Bosea sp. (in: a-proteobacteria) TaxID=1871050 RepID=UPI002E0E71BE|nr:FAD-dependent oxidoreductase [Bosea sp. (in: a-proteobacteria)]